GRQFITLLGGAAAAWPLAARAQQPTKIARVGWLSASLNNPVQALGHEVLVSALRRLGFTEGENLVLEHRPADEGMAKAFAGANELVAAKADVLIADGPELAPRRAQTKMLSEYALAPDRARCERGCSRHCSCPGQDRGFRAIAPPSQVRRDVVCSSQTHLAAWAASVARPMRCAR